jgi:hypothetical protein
MPTNYNIPQPNDVTGVCAYCKGTGCKYCTKPTCPQCNGRISGDACEFCTGVRHGFTSDLVQNTNVALPNTTQRPYAGERPSAPQQQIIIGGRRR